MFSGRRQPSCDGMSRMMREYHVRFCEGLGVKFPGPTRQPETFAGVRPTSGAGGRAEAIGGKADIQTTREPRACPSVSASLWDRQPETALRVTESA